MLADSLIPQGFSHGASGRQPHPVALLPALPQALSTVPASFSPANPPQPAGWQPSPDAAIPKPSWNLRPPQVSRVTHGGVSQAGCCLLARPGTAREGHGTLALPGPGQ